MPDTIAIEVSANAPGTWYVEKCPTTGESRLILDLADGRQFGIYHPPFDDLENEQWERFAFDMITGRRVYLVGTSLTKWYTPMLGEGI